MLKPLALFAENLTKMYGQTTAVRNLQLKIPSGQVHGFLGANGAGKSTTMKMLSGMLLPTSGSVAVEGLSPLENLAEFKQKIGYLPEIPPLYGDLTLLQFLRFCSEIRLPRSHQKLAVEKVMQQFFLAPQSGKLVRHLSKGFRQRLGLASAVLHEPSVLILDEPTAGLDPQSVVEMRQMILTLKGQKTLFLSSHQLSEIELVVDELTIIHKGETKFQGKLAALAQINTSEKTRSLSFTVTEEQENQLFSIQEFRDLGVESIEWDKGKHNYVLVWSKKTTTVTDILQRLLQCGWILKSFSEESLNLESSFLALTQKDDSHVLH
jgi:ABC-2 type transport system ATP-binding protein